MKHVRALLLGGSTIADQVDASGKRRRTDLAEYIRSMHEFDGNIEISIVAREDIAAGYDMQIPDVLEIVREVRKAIDEDQADGVVIVMGTDCMEEAAFAFETLLQTDVPVVVTGAMRVATVRGAEGPANLLNAIRAAASDALSGLGVVVILNEWIHSALYVQKLHPSNCAAFGSEFPIGMVAEGDVSIRTRPIRRKMPWINIKTGIKDVLLQTCYLGMNAKVFDHIEEDGYAGIVVGGTGGCDIAKPVFEKLDALHEKYGDKLPIVVGTRIGKGEPFMVTYGDYKGSPSYFDKTGYLKTGQLDCLKARMLLILLLMSECTPEQIRESFHMYSRTRLGF